MSIIHWKETKWQNGFAVVMAILLVV